MWFNICTSGVIVQNYMYVSTSTVYSVARPLHNISSWLSTPDALYSCWKSQVNSSHIDSYNPVWIFLTDTIKEQNISVHDLYNARIQLILQGRQWVNRVIHVIIRLRVSCCWAMHGWLVQFTPPSVISNWQLFLLIAGNFGISLWPTVIQF